jgi:Flp pilus assembly protein CpaB
VESILSSRLLNSRGGTLLVAGVAAVLAAIVVLVYISQYRNSVNAANSDVKVLVAAQVIPKGTPGGYIGKAQLFAPQEIAQKQVLEGAISDPATLAGRVAIRDISPNQQLTLADFSAVGIETLPRMLAKAQRGVGFSIDDPHGLLSHLQAGDRVDVYGLFQVDSLRCGSGPMIKLLVQNALILSFPGAAGGGLGGGGSKTVVLRVNYEQATNIALAADAGALYLTARPSANAKSTPPQMQTVQNLLLGVPPVRVASRCVGGGAR